MKIKKHQKRYTIYVANFDARAVFENNYYVNESHPDVAANSFEQQLLSLLELNLRIGARITFIVVMPNAHLLIRVRDGEVAIGNKNYTNPQEALDETRRKN